MSAIPGKQMEKEDFIWNRPLLPRHGPSHLAFFFSKIWPILSKICKVCVKQAQLVNNAPGGHSSHLRGPGLSAKLRHFNFFKMKLCHANVAMLVSLV